MLGSIQIGLKEQWMKVLWSVESSFTGFQNDGASGQEERQIK